jgi:hypothetical protein
MTLHFQNIFKYKTFESCEDYPKRDSDCYNDCIMLMDVGHLKQGTYVPSISIAKILYIFDMNGLYRAEESLYDNMINKNENSNDTNSFYDIFTYEQKFDNMNHKFHPYSYHNCKMLKDIGKLKKDSTYSQIAIGFQLVGFNNNEDVIFDELFS